MQKRGQITLFFILGIAILAIIIIVFSFQRELIIPTKINTEPVNLHVQNCLDFTANKTLFLIGLQSGYPDLKERYFYYTNYLYYNGNSLIPSIKEVENSISDKIKKELPVCTDFKKFEPLKIKEDEIKVNTKILDNKIKINMVWPLIIEKNKLKTKIFSFNYEKNIRFIDFLEFTKEFIDAEIKDPEYLCLSCFSKLAEERDFNIEIIEFDENNLVTISEKNKEYDHFIFSFASKFDFKKEENFITGLVTDGLSLTDQLLGYAIGFQRSGAQGLVLGAAKEQLIGILPQEVSKIYQIAMGLQAPVNFVKSFATQKIIEIITKDNPEFASALGIFNNLKTIYDNTGEIELDNLKLKKGNEEAIRNLENMQAFIRLLKEVRNLNERKKVIEDEIPEELEELKITSKEFNITSKTNITEFIENKTLEPKEINITKKVNISEEENVSIKNITVISLCNKCGEGIEFCTKERCDELSKSVVGGCVYKETKYWWGTLGTCTGISEEKNPETIFNKALNLMSKGEYEKAIENLNKIIFIEEKDSEGVLWKVKAQYNICLSHINLKNEVALNECKKVLEFNKNEEDNRYIFLAQGKIQELSQ